MRLFLVIGLLFLPWVSQAQEDSVHIVCRPQSISTLGVRDLFSMYRQRDTLQSHGASGPMQLQINGREVMPTDSISKLYLASLVADYPALDSLWSSYLQPEIQAFSAQKDSLLQHIRAKGWAMRYVQAIRNLKRQQQLNAMGRSKVLLSFHNFNLAADVGLYSRGRYLRRSTRYSQMGQAAKALGLFWGGDFVGFPDPGHVQRLVNSAALVKQYPLLAFEFEKYRDHYARIYAAGRPENVQDTRELLVTLNTLKVGQICACQYALIPPQNNLFSESAYVLADTQAGWVYVQPRGSNGYYYALGRWEFVAKK
ncbi:M15 family metallopeptidase [Aquirufa sp.]|jgi:hypothetical protein|uniref:M15 family metallopeptidase n=1 Tax=Aquirufa sp. TaxID=2676249 RepID=UPI0037C1153A